ncbi:MAG: hypothetical protein M1821_008032 [Bathelium mastoideum]|nr:MAG: hypothetical protein M1821_008032 [Bathelium mastoideum]KAI9693078.1 MAG: hypothetical protein M1822_005073 [Bathelium mastoideum]
MASPSLFHSAPPFPTDVPVAKIPKISLAKLAREDARESEAVLAACNSIGFFLLDLNGDATGEDMIKDVDETFEAVKNVMEMSTEEKMHFCQKPPQCFTGSVEGGRNISSNPILFPIHHPAFSRISSYTNLSYKAFGAMKTETGKPDRCEFYVVTQDDLLGNSPESCIVKDDPLHKHPFTNPPPIESRKPHLEAFVRRGQHAISLILRALSTQLGLPENALRDRMPSDRSSGTIIRLIRYAPSLEPEEKRTGLLPHTDYGSITLLANVIGGLQVLRPDSDPSDEQGWEYVKPEPRCLIVNMADAMVQWTGGVLRSNMHRVNFAPGAQATVPRYSVALLARPQIDTKMGRIVGGRIPLASEDGEDKAKQAEELKDVSAIEWERRKAMALHAGRDIAKSRGGRLLKPLAAG